jgi:hypothetical protein
MAFSCLDLAQKNAEKNKIDLELLIDIFNLKYQEYT